MSKALWIALNGSLTILCCTTISNAQTPTTCTVSSVVHTNYGDEFVVACGATTYRAILPAHIAAIETTAAQYAADERIVALQADQITHLQNALNHAKKVEDIDAKMDAVRQEQLDLKAQELMHYESYTAQLQALTANQPKKSKLDSLPVKFGFAVLGGVANAFTIARRPSVNLPSSSPCLPH